jgi:glycine/D-amino acid oxidase-like deaminating enzyme
MDRRELERRYPQIDLGLAGTGLDKDSEITWGILESNSGVLMARQAVKAVVEQAVSAGVTYVSETVLPPTENSQRKGSLGLLQTASGNEIAARDFVFACGPWLPKLFPALLGELIRVTRQEVFFFGAPKGEDRFSPGQIPAWIDLGNLVYGLPSLDNRGVKIAIDEHGQEFDPDIEDRIASETGLARLRGYMADRVPALAHAPVTETRVCQYENTSNGDFLIDRHPGFENVWIVGGGSGHGFKHGPAVGEHVTSLISVAAEVEPRFSLATKLTTHLRKIF